MECQRRITSGDGIWLHDKETAVDDLKKMIIDWKIVAESHNFGIEGKSFKVCIKNLADYCRFNLKIPADIIGDYYPPLKNFFAMLKEICQSGDLPQGKREIFLCQLVNNGKIIREAISEPIKVLRDKFSSLIDGLNDEEIKNLYAALPITSFTDMQGGYRKNVSDSAKKIQSSQLKSELLTLWREVAGNLLPREWSKEHRTPILAMVPQSEQETAKKVFATVMNPSPDENSVKVAIEYLKNPPKYFSTLNDSQQIEEAFRNAIIDEEDRILIDDNDEVRTLLEQSVSDVYQWHSSNRAKKIVKELAENKYYDGGAYDKVTARVMQMPDDVAKKLLIELVDKSYEVGVKLLKES